MEQLEELINEYKTRKPLLSQRELAEYEYRMVALRTLEGVRGLSRDWLSERFGGSANEYELRQALLGAGIVAGPLWERISKGMSLYTAIRLLRDAKKSAVKLNTSISEALVEAIRVYDTGHVSVLQTGKVIRRANPYTKSIKTTSVQPKNIKDVRELKQAIRGLLNDYANEVSDGLEPYEAKEAREELFDWMNESIDSFQRRIYKLKNNAKEETLYAKIGATRFSNARAILGLKESEFVFGKAIDIRKAKKAYMQRARELHPDSNQGSHEKQTEYQAVNEAFRVLEQYSEQIGAKK